MGTHFASSRVTRRSRSSTPQPERRLIAEVVAEDDTVWVPLAHRRSRSAFSS